jgi:hypothetical protein
MDTGFRRYDDELGRGNRGTGLSEHRQRLCPEALMDEDERTRPGMNEKNDGIPTGMGLAG